MISHKNDPFSIFNKFSSNDNQFSVSEKLSFFSDEKTQQERLKTRNKFMDDEALSRIRSQIPLIQKCEKATHVIDNSGDIKQTKQQVESIYKELIRCKKHWKVRLLLGGVLVSLVGLIVCHMRFWYS